MAPKVGMTPTHDKIPPMTDAELLAAIKEDRPGAFDTFVERYGRRLLAFGLRMCGHREDAEDVFQNTLLKAYERLQTVEDPGALSTWLFRIVSTQCLMMRRKVGPKREISFDELKPRGADLAEPVEIPDVSQMPDDEAARLELQATLESALAEIPADMRIAVLLRDVEGFSTRETAEILGIGPSAVKMRLHRGRLALRRHLEQTGRGSAAGL